MTFINCTPHAIVLNNGTVFQPSGVIPRVYDIYGDLENGIMTISQGQVQGLPEKVEGTFIIVSAMVMNASDRGDIVAPATGHKDCVRNEKGQIVSVPCFVRKG